MIEKKPNQVKSFFPEKITKIQARGTGVALVLFCLLSGYLCKSNWFFSLSIILLVINMIFPRFYAPVARLFFGVSNILGAVLTKIMLAVLFITVLTPMGVVRRLFGYDTLQLKKWKKDAESVFKIRNHKYKSSDLEPPY